MAKEEPILSDAQLVAIKKLVEETTNPLISQFEKLKKQVKETFDKNVNILSERSESTERAVDELTNALNILESDVRAIGGKGLGDKPKPKPIGKEQKSKFAFTLLDLAGE